MARRLLPFIVVRNSWQLPLLVWRRRTNRWNDRRLEWRSFPAVGWRIAAKFIVYSSENLLLDSNLEILQHEKLLRKQNSFFTLLRTSWAHNFASILNSNFYRKYLLSLAWLDSTSLSFHWTALLASFSGATGLSLINVSLLKLTNNMAFLVQNTIFTK